MMKFWILLGMAMKSKNQPGACLQHMVCTPVERRLMAELVTYKWGCLECMFYSMAVQSSICENASRGR